VTARWLRARRHLPATLQYVLGTMSGSRVHMPLITSYVYCGEAETDPTTCTNNQPGLHAALRFRERARNARWKSRRGRTGEGAGPVPDAQAARVQETQSAAPSQAAFTQLKQSGSEA
jgi:hypothetical protein